jgi:general stress protein CsbA
MLFFFNLILFFIFFPLLGISFVYISYMTWVSEIQTVVIVEKNYAFFYIISKYILPLYSIWSFYLTIRLFKRIYLILRKKKKKDNLRTIIKNLQSALDKDFK